MKKVIMFYKMARPYDPDLRLGVWGSWDCMGKIRSREFDAVIGVGGTGPEPRSHAMFDKIVWGGSGPLEVGVARRAAVLAFDHFWPGAIYQATKRFPILMGLLYDDGRFRRAPYIHEFDFDPQLDSEVNELLKIIEQAPPSKWGNCQSRKEEKSGGNPL